MGEAGSVERFGNEFYAWERTLEFLEFLQAQGSPVPPLFRAIQKAAQSRGLRTWVQAVIE